MARSSSQGRSIAACVAGAALNVACAGEPRDDPTVPTVAVTAAPVSVRELDAGVAPALPAKAKPIAWRTDFDTARAEARRENRRVLVYVHADWSATATAFEREVWVDERIRRGVASLIAVRIDATDEAELNRAAVLGVDAVPAIAILDPDGSVLGRRAGAASADVIRLWLKPFQ